MRLSFDYPSTHFYKVNVRVVPIINVRISVIIKILCFLCSCLRGAVIHLKIYDRMIAVFIFGLTVNDLLIINELH